MRTPKKLDAMRNDNSESDSESDSTTDNFNSDEDLAIRKRKRKTADSESDDAYVPGGKVKPKKKPKRKAKETKIPSRASITILAQITESDDNGVAHVDKSVLERIKKALALADHPGTSEQEARAAMRMATKLMSQHSVTQAAVLATMDEKKDRLKKAGMSVVSVRCKEGKKMNLSTWAITLECAMTIFFDCKCYTESFGPDGRNRNRVDFVFYGLTEQTIAAAYGFEMAYNLTMTWRVENKEAKGMHAKNCYCHGVADGLFDLAMNEKETEQIEAKRAEVLKLEMAIKEEDEERKKERNRLDVLDEKRGTTVKEADDEDSKHPLTFAGDFGPTEPDSDSDCGDLMYPVDKPDGDDDSKDDFIGADFINDGTVPDLDLDALTAKADARSKAGKNKKEFPKKRTSKKLSPMMLPKIKHEEVEPKLEDTISPWESSSQLIVFRETAKTQSRKFIHSIV